MCHSQKCLSKRLTGSHTTAITRSCGIRAKACLMRGSMNNAGSPKPRTLCLPEFSTRAARSSLKLSISFLGGMMRKCLWNHWSSRSLVNSIDGCFSKLRRMEVVPQWSAPTTTKSRFKSDHCAISLASNSNHSGGCNSKSNFNIAPMNLRYTTVLTVEASQTLGAHTPHRTKSGNNWNRARSSSGSQVWNAVVKPETRMDST
mmetsp:Transcript_71130/g.206299  ORF Transcript_71130/g.206299 Transcript_71130/m.206299 type:complete len:202 (-) Transcript_71130:164-769(-)